MSDENNDTVRIDSYLSDLGFCARRKALDFLNDHKVEFKGERILQSGMRVPLNASLIIDGKELKTNNRKIYLLLNKPRGYICSSSDDFNRPLALSLLTNYKDYRLFNIGRLDFDSCGLIFFTNDGDFAYTLSHPSCQIEKEYYIETFRPFTMDMLNKFKQGIEIDGVIYKLNNYELQGNTQTKVNIVLHEGKNREIRNVFKYFGCNVKYLQRIRIGMVSLNGIKEGFSRELTKTEILSFFKNSSTKLF